MLAENLIQLFEDTTVKKWDAPCFSDYGISEKPMTYGEVANKIREFHEIFKFFGIEPGDKIAICGKNSTNWALTYLSVLTCKAVTVPILADFAVDDIRHVINHSDSKLFFVGSSIFEKIGDLGSDNLDAVISLEDFRVLYMKDPSKKDELEETWKSVKERCLADPVKREDFHFQKIPNDTLASIVYTSGTTGFSKGVMLNNNALMANVRFLIDHLAVEIPGNILSFLPLAHSLGCSIDFLAEFARGAHVHFLSKNPTPKVLLKAFQELKPDLVVSVPLILEKIYTSKIQPMLETPQMQFLLKIPFVSDLIYKKIGEQINETFGGRQYEMIAGGAAFNPKIEEFYKKCGVRFMVGYGMTECAPLVSYYEWYEEHHIGTCGKIINTLTAKIDAPDESGTGEICLKGENVMLGYYKLPNETKAAFDNDGWFHTGDLGYIDEDGFLFIRGRIKNMILSASGQNIYPEEVEAKLNNLPYIQESLLLEGKEGKLIAFVYPDKEKIEKDRISEDMLREIMLKNRERINKMVPSFAKISEIKIFPEEFIKTSTKKIKRRLYTTLVD